MIGCGVLGVRDKSMTRILSAVLGFRGEILEPGHTETVAKVVGTIFKPEHLYVDSQSHGFTICRAFIAQAEQPGIMDVPASAFGHNPNKLIDYANAVLVEVPAQRPMGAPVEMSTAPRDARIAFVVRNDGPVRGRFVAALFGAALL